LTASQIELKPKSLPNHSFKIHDPIELESGESLRNLTISYSTYGQLNSDASNVIWVCHALTADANPKEWWAGLVGKNDLYNPEDYYIVCVNIIGSAYGSTSPLNCEDKKRYHNFPHISIRDNIIVFDKLRQYLGINKIHTLIGGSMGGQQAIEWAIIDDNICKNLILLATNAVMTPWAVALNQSQRLAIKADQSWGKKHENAAKSGLKAARSIALLSYRNNQAYNNTQGDIFGFNKTVKAVSYQDYQGDKLVNRFNAYSYYALTKTMDSHDVGRDRGGVAMALKSIKANTLVIAVSSDLLFPIEDSELLAEHIPNAELIVIESDFGHDGFLIETVKIGNSIKKFYQSHADTKPHKNIGLFGFGCVGQGVYQLLQNSNIPNQIKSIAVKNEFKARKTGHELITTNHYQLFQDTQIKTVIEVINNPEQAYNIAKFSINSDKNFITANKKMVANNLAEIIGWNKENKATALYEAAVAGSIPIIRNLDTYLDYKYTDNIRAIVNGSSNYILTQMFKNNSSYDDALKQAQDSGFAELDPIDDVGGFDSKYKSVILAAHGFGLLCHPDEVKNFGIQSIQTSDIQFALDNKITIKLVASIKRNEDKGISVTVMPQFVENSDELAKIDNENNLVIVNNNETDFLFNGAGAGSIATGTAILADLRASQNNYRYQYHIDKNLGINNDFDVKVYINKRCFNEKIERKIITETYNYLIVELNYQELISMKLDDVFVAIIK